MRSDGPLVGARLTVRGVLYERLVRDSLALVHGKSSQKAVCKLGRSCDIRNNAILNAVFTPFSMLFLRRSQCSFYAIFIVGFTLGILSATHSEQSHQSALGYLRSHISANEISLVSPLLAAAS